MVFSFGTAGVSFSLVNVSYTGPIVESTAILIVVFSKTVFSNVISSHKFGFMSSSTPLIHLVMPQTARRKPWSGTMDGKDWKEDGLEDLYLQTLVDGGTLTSKSTWSDIKSLPEAESHLGQFSLQFLRNKFAKYKGIAKAKEEEAENAKGKPDLWGTCTFCRRFICICRPIL